MEWTEKRFVPDLNHTKVADGYENVCESCADWGRACETCSACVPLINGRYHVEEQQFVQYTLCGIPVGVPCAI